jgi:hypothetical protein
LQQDRNLLAVRVVVIDAEVGEVEVVLISAIGDEREGATRLTRFVTASVVRSFLAKDPVAVSLVLRTDFSLLCRVNATLEGFYKSLAD